MRVILALHSQVAVHLAATLRGQGHEVLVLDDERPATDALAETAVATLRERLRRQLDQAVTEFNPQLIHAEGLTFWGQLASETGVPYVATLVADDLEHAEGSRPRELAEQGAENARCVLVPAELAEASKPLLGGVEHVAPAPWWPDALDPLETVYRAAINRPASGLA
ncbi:MAG: hypothetical protein U0836_00660 [Pirellulales bacterium]